MNYKTCILLSCIITIQASIIRNDQESYNYCKKHKHSFIAIMWPIAQGNNMLVKETINKYGKLLYEKNVYLTPKTAYTLLKKAHYNIKNLNMKNHLAWYFPPGTYDNPARIFVIYFKDTDTAIACKYAIRKLFPDLQYRSIHINDFHHEAVDLANIFFK